MCKSCDNCYHERLNQLLEEHYNHTNSIWGNYKDMHCIYEKSKPKENTCEKHTFMCNECEDSAKYKYHDKYYCKDCLLKKFDVEEATETHYYLDGEHLGSDDDMDEVICGLDDCIKIID